MPAASTDHRRAVHAATASDFHTLRIHMVGIGGAGMSGLAAVLLRRGARVSGSDARMSIDLARLGTLGAAVSAQQRADTFPIDAELVVATAAVPDDHPELVEARRRGIEIVRYSEMLGLLMSQHVGVAISGTHGKSTTTAWLTYVLRQAGLDPSFVVGALVDQLGGGSGVGDGPHFIAEACEYARSFLHLRPRHAAILNIDADHLDYYADLDAIGAAFADFARLLPANGRLIANGADPRCRALVRANVAAAIETFGLDEYNHWRADDLRIENGFHAFTVVAHGQPLGRVRLGIAGAHSVLNALAVVALARECGVSWPAIERSLGEFRGAKRRLELRGSARGVNVADDYAHHPTEIRATLQAARERFRPRRLWVVFQPHQYSRTRHLLEEFVHSFGVADCVVVPEIYAARDSADDRAAVSAELVAHRLRVAGVEAVHIPEFDAIADFLASSVTAGDLVITMGAGNVGKLADDLVQRLGGHLPA
ncbi:MAG: UDP-N-acetylmuramate--L-alanine ligase [Phycisphaerae bacterium]